MRNSPSSCRFLAVAATLLVGFMALAGGSSALEKVKLATSLKKAVHQGLPILAAQEKGFWQSTGLEVEWVPFPGGTPMIQAAAARVINLGLSAAGTDIAAASRGVPIFIVADLGTPNAFFFWVRGDSRIRTAEGLRGTKIGVTRFGGVAHAYAQGITKVLGLSREARLVAAGGIAESLAALKSGTLDVLVNTSFVIAPLIVKGEAREILAVQDYFPREWINDTIFSRKDFAQNQSRLLKGSVTGLIRGASYAMKDRAWALEKIKSFFDYSPEAANFVYNQALRYGSDGKIKKKAIENVKEFLIEYGIVPREKVPPTEELYSNEFTS